MHWLRKLLREFLVYCRLFLDCVPQMFKLTSSLLVAHRKLEEVRRKASRYPQNEGREVGKSFKLSFDCDSGELTCSLRPKNAGGPPNRLHVLQVRDTHDLKNVYVDKIMTLRVQLSI